MKSVTKISVLLAVLFLSFSLFADLKVKTVVTDGTPKSAKITGWIYVKGDLMKVDDGAGHVTLYDFVKKEIISIDTAAKSWSKMTKQQVDDAKARVKKQLAENYEMQKAALSQLPPEKRAQVEAQMAALMGVGGKSIPVKYAKTDRTLKWNGTECRIYEGMKERVKNDEVCVVPAEKLKCNMADLEKIKQFSLDFAMDENDVMIWKEMKTIGVPVIIRLLRGGQTAALNTIESVETPALSDDIFKVPAGYKETVSPL